VCLDIHLHGALHHTFAFINIHLDIHRIIIIITQAVASALKLRLQQKEKEAVLCFTVYEKKGRCFSPSVQKCSVRSHRSTLYIDGRVRIYYKLSIQASLKSIELQLRLRHPLSFGFVFLLFSFVGFIILCILQYCKEDSSLKEEVSTRYDFVTGLR
jgi:hypothetical protein